MFQLWSTTPVPREEERQTRLGAWEGVRNLRQIRHILFTGTQAFRQAHSHTDHLNTGGNKHHTHTHINTKPHRPTDRHKYRQASKGEEDRSSDFKYIHSSTLPSPKSHYTTEYINAFFGAPQTLDISHHFLTYNILRCLTLIILPHARFPYQHCYLNWPIRPSDPCNGRCKKIWNMKFYPAELFP